MINDKQIKGHSNLVKRDNAVINTDKQEYEAAKNRRQKEQIINDLLEKTNHLENNIQDINEKLNLILVALQGNK